MKFFKKVRKAAKHYDEWLEGQRTNVESAKKEYTGIKKIVANEVRKTKELYREVSKPTAVFAKRTHLGMQRSLKIRSTGDSKRLPRLF